MTIDERIMVVCTANQCRSPLGQALLQRIFANHPALSGVAVASAGTAARPDHPAAGSIQAIASDWGIDLSDHRSRPLTADLVDGVELVLTMEESHRATVLRLAPRALARTFTWLELGRLTEDADTPAVWPDARARAEDPIGPVAALAGQAHRRRPRVAEPTGPEDVEDPIGQDHEAYQKMASVLVEASRPFLSLLVATPAITMPTHRAEPRP